MEISQQISCAERELKRRKKHYPRLVEQKQLPPQVAQQEIEGMTAILRTLNNYKKMTGWMAAIETNPEAAAFSKMMDNKHEKAITNNTTT